MTSYSPIVAYNFEDFNPFFNFFIVFFEFYRNIMYFEAFYFY